jgi:predicted nucleotide-binding protein
MPKKKPKPRIFVGSSMESLSIARAVRANLDSDGEVTLWDHGVFKISDFGLDSLLEATRSHDFAIFVFAPDDKLTKRGRVAGAVRDNVLFELGLFMGRVGRERVFVLLPYGVELHFPSDLAGWTTARYDPKRKDLASALGVACDQIRRRMEEEGRYQEGLPTRLLQTVAEIIQRASRMPRVSTVDKPKQVFTVRTAPAKRYPAGHSKKSSSSKRKKSSAP